MGYNEADVVRLTRPKGKKCRCIQKFFLEKSIFQDFQLNQYNYLILLE